MLLEMGREHPAGAAAAAHLGEMRTMIEGVAIEAGLNDAQEFAREWHMITKGAIIASFEGDAQATERGKRLVGELIERHRALAGP